MKRIYSAANLPDAHIVKHLLEQAGIPTHIFNGNAQSALGELPMAAAYPQVWIAQLHQEHHARRVIADYQHRAPTDTHKICAACTEASPSEFDLCWQCGAILGENVSNAA